jgi:hypothetical protein
LHRAVQQTSSHATPQWSLTRFVLIALACGSLPLRAGAHDFWLVPSSFRPDVGAAVSVALRVGDPFPTGEPHPRDPAHERRFVVVGPGGESRVPGRPGADPAGAVGVDRPGTYVLGYWSRPTVVELAPERFAVYVASEELAESVRRLRAVPSDPDRPERDAFSRCAKAVIVAGDGPAAGHDRLLGFPLELVPERNPAALAPGDELPVRLLYDGAPLPNTPVVAMPAGLPGRRTWTRTDSAGRARLRLDRSGPWLVRSIRLTPASDRTVADWESLWASLTFEIAPHDSWKGDPR